jgi:hypothetical protein
MSLINQQSNQIQSSHLPRQGTPISNGFTKSVGPGPTSNFTISSGSIEVVSESEINEKIGLYVGQTSTQIYLMKFLDIIEGKTTFGFYSKYFTYNSFSKKGWWNKGFRSSNKINGHNIHMLVISIISEIAGIRFEDFPTIDKFMSQLYYLTKRNKLLGDFILDSLSLETSVSTFGKKSRNLITKLIMERRKRYILFENRFQNRHTGFIQNRFENIFAKTFRLGNKVPCELIYYIIEFLGFDNALRFIGCEHCIRAGKSIDVALNHSSSRCKSVCIKCKILGKPVEIYSQHTTENCKHNKCQYCIKRKYNPNHLIFDCKFLDVNVCDKSSPRVCDKSSPRVCDKSSPRVCEKSSINTQCGECKYKNDWRVSKTHNTLSCKFTTYCVYCHSLSKSPKEFNSHTISTCKQYNSDSSTYKSYLEKYKFRNRVSSGSKYRFTGTIESSGKVGAGVEAKADVKSESKYNNYLIESEVFYNMFYDEDDSENDSENNDNYYEDEEEYMYRTFPGYARFIDIQEDFYRRHGYYKGQFGDYDDDYDDECNDCGYRNCICKRRYM